MKQIFPKITDIFASKFKDLYSSVPNQDLIEDIERYMKGAAECVPTAIIEGLR